MFVDVLTAKVIKGRKRNYFKALILSHIERVHFLKNNDFIKKLFKPEREHVLIRNLIGKFHVVTTNESVRLTNYLTEVDVRNWIRTDERKKIFIDIGANIGFYPVFLRNKGYEKIICFEPSKKFFKILNYNISANEITNAETHNLALDKKKRKHFFLEEKNNIGSSRLVKKKAMNVDIVKTNTFDNISKTTNIRSEDISFIKIDVEGFEYNVLKGMSKTLNNLQKDTYLIIEIWDKSKYTEQIFTFLKQNNILFIKKIASNYLFKKS